MFMRTSLFCAAVALCAGVAAPKSAAAQDNYLGEIVMGGWNFCPRGTARTDGQLLPIASYSALFSLLGTQFGGDGRTTFALPDLRGRVAMHTGTGPGLTPRPIGQRGGSETNTLNINQMPSHTHILRGSTEAADSGDPTNRVAANTGRDDAYTGSANASMSSGAIQNSGNGQAFNNMQPFEVITYCIVTEGIYPSRN